MRRRLDVADLEGDPDRELTVMTISQAGEIRRREAGKGNSPPQWLGSYLGDTPATWYSARSNDVVYSSIDLWKGCIAVVPGELDGALVTKEFPIYEVVDRDLDPEFLQNLLRTRYYQRAFRAITTGHSNRRRTQQEDFEALEITFPESLTQQRTLVQPIVDHRQSQRDVADTLKGALNEFSDIIDGRGDEQLPEIEAELVEEES